MAEKQFDKYQYDQQYLKDNYKWINLGFNTNKPEDMELYSFIKTQPEKQAPYIKELIRKAMQTGSVEPKLYPATRYNGPLYACGDCKHELTEKKPRFCPYCGKPVNWDQHKHE